MYLILLENIFTWVTKYKIYVQYRLTLMNSYRRSGVAQQKTTAPVRILSLALLQTILSYKRSLLIAQYLILF